MFSDLDGKSVLITGSSSGIGAAVAKGFASLGSRVAVHGPSREDVMPLVEEIKAAGGQVIATHGDVQDTANVKRMIDETVDAFNELDVLINNAGALYKRVRLDEQDDDLYERVTDINIRSVVAGCRFAVPHLRKSKGCIINTGSVAGHNGGGIGIGLYAGAKGFVHSWTRNMALELGPDGIRVNCVSPGVVQTAFHNSTSPEILENVRKSIPLRRLGQPEDYIGIFLFLASDSLAGYINGQVIEVNGGQYFK